jgi:hypothetical protein
MYLLSEITPSARQKKLGPKSTASLAMRFLTRYEFVSDVSPYCEEEHRGCQFLADTTLSISPGTRNSPQVGSDMMVAEIKSKSTARPTQKNILGGHSQGGGVTVGETRRLLADLPKDTFDTIVTVTIFGILTLPGSCKELLQILLPEG